MVLETAVISPLALTVRWGTVVAVPYVPTFELTVAKVVVIPDDVTSPDKLPVIVAADPLALPVTLPVKLAVIVPALKLPELSRETTVEDTFELVAASMVVTAVAITDAVLPPTVATVGPG